MVRAEEPEVIVDGDEGRRAAADGVEQRHQLRHRRHLHGPCCVQAETAADDDATDDQRPGRDADPEALRIQDLTGQDQDSRRADGDRHAAGRHQVAVPCRGRRVHTNQAEDERDGAGQPADADEDLDDVERGHEPASASSVAGFGAVGFFRNIWSIRSVTT